MITETQKHKNTRTPRDKLPQRRFKRGKQKQEKILIIGGGGREHALGWKLTQSSRIGKLYFAPGNGGTSYLGTNININPLEIKKLVKFARKKDIDLTIVGPEEPLAHGIVDKFQNQNLAIFGPTQLAARLESSKAWANNFMKRHNIPCPKFRIFLNHYEAIRFVKTTNWPELVIKGSGLAGGKAVIVCDSKKEAIKAVKKIMIERAFGIAGEKIVIQERLYGQEVSIIAFSDGKTTAPLLPAQDHKPVYDNDKGLNTGGMGAYAPTPFVTPNLLKRIQNTILQPAIDGMRKEDCPFVGMLYAGLMLTDKGPKVLEFNVRFGDPEAQPQMLLLKSDLLQIITACINRTLAKQNIAFHDGAAICVVLASAGYPKSYKTGKFIYGLSADYADIQVFHAGTTLQNDKILTDGGRVLGITAHAQNINTAIKNAYSVIGKNDIHFDNMYYRRDIGAKALKFAQKDMHVRTKLSKLRLVILISGSGSTMESILKACHNNKLPNIIPVGVISSSKSAKGIKKAENFGVETLVVDPKDYRNKVKFGNALLKILDEWGADLVSQNGWMPLTPQNVVNKYKGKIINQHPAPLDPEHKNGEHYDFGGKDMYGIIPHAAVCYFRKLVLANQPSWHTKRYIPTEATVHFVTEKYDDGEVVERTPMNISDDDTPELLQKKLLPLEHKTVIAAIRDFAQNKITVQKRPRPFVRNGEEKFLYKAKQKAIENYSHH